MNKRIIGILSLVAMLGLAQKTQSTWKYDPNWRSAAIIASEQNYNDEQWSLASRSPNDIIERYKLQPQQRSHQPMWQQQGKSGPTPHCKPSRPRQTPEEHLRAADVHLRFVLSKFGLSSSQYENALQQCANTYISQGTPYTKSRIQ